FAGLPIAYKDVVPTKGIRTTWGSPIYRDHVPQEDYVIVERLSAAGATTLCKTNTPEVAAGSHTFNKPFGATRNAYPAPQTFPRIDLRVGPPARARHHAARPPPRTEPPRQARGPRDLEHPGGPQAHAREPRPRASAA